MKKTAPKKLTLSRETLAELTDQDIWNAKGGAIDPNITMSRTPNICCA